MLLFSSRHLLYVPLSSLFLLEVRRTLTFSNTSSGNTSYPSLKVSRHVRSSTYFVAPAIPVRENTGPVREGTLAP